MHKTMVGDVEITSERGAAWVNGPAGCAARFTRYGYEVERRDADAFTHEVRFAAGRELDEHDWRAFTAACERLLQVTIPESHKPAFAAVEKI